MNGPSNCGEAADELSMRRVLNRAANAAVKAKGTNTARWNPLLDCQLIALSFAVNVFGKSRVQRRLRRSTLARAESAGRP